MTAPPAEDSILRSDPSNLPVGLRELFARGPMPSGAIFYEHRIPAERTQMIFRGAMALVLVGVIMTALAALAEPLALAGLICIVGGAVLMNSVRGKRRQIRLQANGFHVQQGVYLYGDWLVVRTPLDTLAVPRKCFISMEDSRLHYRYRDTPRTIPLQTEFVGVIEPGIVYRAIEAWAAKE